MAFAGLNYLAILAAAAAGWLFGMIWYMALGKPWMADIGLTPEAMAENRKKPGAFLPFIYSIAADIIMAWVLAGLIAHLGDVSVRTGLISGAFMWLGFVATAMLVNYSFAGRPMRLFLIDAGHWLGVLLIMGAVIGALGV